MKKQIRNKIELVGKKLGMTQTFSQEGEAIPVTVVELEKNIVCEIRTPQKNGYAAIQYGGNEKKDKHLSKPLLGNLKKKNLPNFSYLKEFRIKTEDLEKYKIGEPLDPSSILTPKEKVDVTGKSIGKGFQGMIRLHNKSRGFKSHGSKSYRIPGSIGGHTFPGRVFPGKKMASRMGNEMVTARNLEVVEYLKEKNIVLIKGAVPGTEGSLVTIKSAIKYSEWNV